MPAEIVKTLPNVVKARDLSGLLSEKTTADSLSGAQSTVNTVTIKFPSRDKIKELKDKKGINNDSNTAASTMFGFTFGLIGLLTSMSLSNTTYIKLEKKLGFGY